MPNLPSPSAVFAVEEKELDWVYAEESPVVLIRSVVMKRNSLTTALLAGLAGAAGLATTANAVNLNPDGLGQVLIYPFYTVDGGNNTQVSVVNTTNRVKAVKVRFLEARNSKEVLDFNLYLSPFDVWTGATISPPIVSGSPAGPGALISNDNSCTVPRIPAGVSIPFRNFAYAGANQDHPASAAAVLSALERTRQGHVEMIEMGLLQTGGGATQLAEEATHTTGGVPANCQALVDAWLPGAPWSLNGAANIDLPSGGLFGAGAIIEVATGALTSYNAEAIEGFYTDAAFPGTLHSAPGGTDPDLRDADNGANVVANVFANNAGVLNIETFAVGDPTPDAVSLLFMHDAIYNEFNTEASIGGISEWLVTFPTKRYYVDNAVAAVAPFTNVFRDNGSACEPITISYWDREERVPGTIPGTVDFSPPPPAGAPTVAAFCNEANVLAFNQAGFTSTGLLGAAPTTGLAGIGSNLTTSTVGTLVFQNGWTRIAFNNPLTPAQDNVLTVASSSRQYFGLPAVGFWAVGYINTASAPGILATYTGTFRHRGSRATSG
jgi:hypothetical protein